MEYLIDNRSVSFVPDGETVWGRDGVLLERDDNLTADTPWAAQGCKVIELLAEEEQAAASSAIGFAASSVVAGPEGPC